MLINGVLMLICLVSKTSLTLVCLLLIREHFGESFQVVRTAMSPSTLSPPPPSPSPTPHGRNHPHNSRARKKGEKIQEQGDKKEEGFEASKKKYSVASRCSKSNVRPQRQEKKRSQNSCGYFVPIFFRHFCMQSVTF